MKLVIAGLVAATSIASAATGAQAQSFNCRRAYFPDEKLICTSPRLSMLDERLDWIFRQNMRLLAKPGRDALDREEERWVVARRRCGSDPRCVEGFYRSRIGELTGRLGEARDDDRDEPSATHGPGRDGPPPEHVSSEPPPAEPPRAERGQPDRSERATAAPTAKRQSSRGRQAEAAARKRLRGARTGRRQASRGNRRRPGRERRHPAAPPLRSAGWNRRGDPRRLNRRTRPHRDRQAAAPCRVRASSLPTRRPPRRCEADDPEALTPAADCPASAEPTTRAPSRRGADRSRRAACRIPHRGG